MELMNSHDTMKMYSHETFIKLKLTEQELKKTIQELEALKSAIDQSSLAIVMDHRGIITHVNSKFCEVSRFSREELIGQSLQNIFPSKNLAEIWMTIQSGETWKGEVCNQAKDGSEYWLEGTIVPVLDQSNQIPYQFISILNDITKRKNAERKIVNLLTTDELTGLPSRKRFMQLLDEQIFKKEPTTLFIVNIERFTVINDTFGHDIGDRILLEMARRLKELRLVQPSRLTADEFAFFIPYFNKYELNEFNEYLINALKAPYNIEGFHLNINFRVGVSRFPEDGLDSDTLINNCRMAMRSHSPSADSHIFNYKNQFANIRAIQLLNELTYESTYNQFEITYQPRVRIQTGEIVGVEAFLRWKHPELGTLDLNEFLALAEEVGLALPAGKWFVKQVCMQMKVWQDKGYPLPVMCIRLFPETVNEKSWLKNVQQILQETNIEPSQLQIDLMTNKKEYPEFYLYKTVLALKKIGLRAGLANFGTNHSRLSDLKMEEIDSIQLDRSLIENIHINYVNEDFLRSLLSLCHRLRKEIVVVGVSKREKLKVLENLEIEMLIQGPIYGRPVPKEIFEDHLIRGKCEPSSSSDTQGMERRKYFRIGLPYPMIAQLKIFDDGKRKTNSQVAFEGLIENIGPGGVRILATNELEEGSMVRISFKILNNEWKTIARVAYAKPIAYDIFIYGMSFRMDEFEREQLVSLLNQFAILVNKKKFVPDCDMIKEDKIKFLLEKTIDV